MKDDILQLEEFLKGLKKPVLTPESREMMKNNILHSIGLEKRVGEFVREAKKEVVLSGVTKAFLKEQIMAYVASSRSFLWAQLFSYSKRFVGVLTLGTFLFGIFGFAFVDIKVASADSFTYVENVTGEARVYRGGEELEVYQNMVLEKGDTVTTQDDSLVSIKFLDKSVARLGEDTTVYLKEVEADHATATTNVEVEVRNGVVWSRVLNLINSNSSFSVKVGDVYAYAKKAAFNVSKDEDESKVEVYSSIVNFVTSDQSDKKVKTGESAIVKTSRVNKDVVSFLSSVQEGAWVEQNLNQDKVHIAKVEEESAKALKDSVGALPASPLYGLKNLKAGVVSLFTFDDVASKKVDLENSEMKFMEWTVLLRDGKGNTEKAEEIFNSYVAQVDEFNELVKTVRISGDTLYADELEAYLNQKIKERQNELKAVLPASPMYVAKSYLFQAEVAAASNDATKAVVKQVQATQKLAEVQDLVEAGDTQLAAQTIGDYAKAISEVKKEVIALPDSEKAGVASAVVNSIKDDKEILSSIQDASQSTSSTDDVTRIAVQVEREVVDPIANNLEVEAASKETVSSTEIVGSEIVEPVVIKPVTVQRNGKYGVSVVGTGDSEKPLDPLLNLNR